MTQRGPSIDAVFEALADSHRRLILTHLHQVREASVERLRAIVDRQPNGRVDTRTGDRASGRSAVELRHVHLPKLADVGLIEYDREAGRVEYVGGSELEPLIEILSPERPRD